MGEGDWVGTKPQKPASPISSAPPHLPTNLPIQVGIYLLMLTTTQITKGTAIKLELAVFQYNDYTDTLQAWEAGWAASSDLASPD